MQNRQFIVNLAILIILNLLIKPYWILFIDTGVQIKVGNAHYGEYSTLLQFSFLFSIILDLGLTNFNNKNIAQNNHLLSKHFSSLLALKFSLGVIYLVVVMIAAVCVGYDFRFMKLLLLLGINQFFISFILYLRSNLQGLHLFKTDSLVSVMDRVIMIGICFALFLNWFGLDVDIMNYVYAQTIGYSLTALITFWIVLKETHTFKLSWNWRFSFMILKKSFPFAILVLLQTFYNRIDQVMLEAMLPEGVGNVQVGIYAKGFRLLEAANMIAFLFAAQLLPIFSRMVEYKEDVQNLVKLSFTLLVTLTIIVSIGCAFYNEQLCMIINKSTDSSTVFSVLMFCFTASAISYIFGTLLTANGNLRQMNIMALSGIGLNLILNLILIPQFQALGSAVASITTQFFTAIAQIFIAKKVFDFKVNKRLIIALVFFIFGVVAINYLSLQITKLWMVNFVIMVISSGLWAFATGMLNLKSALRFVKYK